MPELEYDSEFAAGEFGVGVANSAAGEFGSESENFGEGSHRSRGS